VTKTLEPKAKNRFVTVNYLEHRTRICESTGHKKAKWIELCEVLLKNGFEIHLYEAQQTVSKYLTLKRDGKEFKVRFSNHKPSKWKEENGDCDFFVGIANTTITTTRDALDAIKVHFKR